MTKLHIYINGVADKAKVSISGIKGDFENGNSYDIEGDDDIYIGATNTEIVVEEEEETIVDDEENEEE